MQPSKDGRYIIFEPGDKNFVGLSVTRGRCVRLGKGEATDYANLKDALEDDVGSSLLQVVPWEELSIDVKHDV